MCMEPRTSVGSDLAITWLTLVQGGACSGTGWVLTSHSTITFSNCCLSKSSYRLISILSGWVSSYHIIYSNCISFSLEFKPQILKLKSQEHNVSLCSLVPLAHRDSSWIKAWTWRWGPSCSFNISQYYSTLIDKL